MKRKVETARGNSMFYTWYVPIDDKIIVINVFMRVLGGYINDYGSARVYARNHKTVQANPALLEFIDTHLPTLENTDMISIFEVSDGDVKYLPPNRLESVVVE